MPIIIRRRTLEERWERTSSRRLVYGRRKTGKSFFVREFTEWDKYYLVGRGGYVWDIEKRGRKFTYEEFLNIFPEVCEGAVVDEFHRLPTSFLDQIQAYQPKEITLVTSTLHLAKELVSGNSPIMGMFSEIEVGLISPLDVLRDISEYYDGRELLEMAVYLREPLLLEYVPERGLRDVLHNGLRHAERIVSEIFTEEEKRYTKSYRAVLLAITQGTTKFSQIINEIVKEAGVSPTAASYYIQMLVDMGIIRRIPVFGERKSVYRHVSSLLDLYYYLEGKYGISDLWLVQEDELTTLLPRHVEWFAEDYFSELYGLRPVKILKPEVDIALVRFNRLAFLGEVKWKDKITKKEVREVEEKFSEVEKRFGEVERKVLVVPDASSVPETELEVWDVERMRRAVNLTSN